MRVAIGLDMAVIIAFALIIFAVFGKDIIEWVRNILEMFWRGE